MPEPTPNVANQNAPVTGASITAAVGLVLAAFTSLSPEQVAAVTAVVGILAQLAVQRWHAEPRTKT